MNEMNPVFELVMKTLRGAYGDDLPVTLKATPTSLTLDLRTRDHQKDAITGPTLSGTGARVAGQLTTSLPLLNDALRDGLPPGSFSKIGGPSQ